MRRRRGSQLRRHGGLGGGALGLFAAGLGFGLGFGLAGRDLGGMLAGVFDLGQQPLNLAWRSLNQSVDHTR